MKRSILLGLFCVSTYAAAADLPELLKQGIALHDQGQYQQAIEKYQQLLAIDPDNEMVCHELALSYMVSNQNDLCVATTQNALSLPRGLSISSRAKFLTLQGNCYSQLGKKEQALQLFKQSLSISPNDAQTHLNAAVTLMHLKQHAEANKYLKNAIRNAPRYPTPYLYLANLLMASEYRLPAFYFFCQFFMLEPNTGRSVEAARNAYRLLLSGVQKTAEGKYEIAHNPQAPKDEGDYGQLELFMSLAAATAVSEKTDAPPAIQRYTQVFTDLVKSSQEMIAKQPQNTFTEQYAMKNIWALSDKDSLLTFAYLMAAKAGIKDAESWLTEHKQALKKLGEDVDHLYK